MKADNLLPGFELSENDMVNIAMQQPLELKIEKAIALMQMYEQEALQLAEHGYYLAFSGGKDSIVMERLAKLAGVKYGAWYNNTTIDPPELVRFIKREYPEVKWNNPKTHLCRRIIGKRTPPTRIHRWCCAEYKEKGGDGTFKMIGVRVEESARRKGIWKEVVIHKYHRNNEKILCPVLYRTEKDVWEFIKQQNMPYCSLYDEGFERLGCIGCPLSTPIGQKKAFARYPRYEALWKKAFKDLWENYRTELNRKGELRFFAKYKSWQEFWEWWISGKGQGEDNGMCQGAFMFSGSEDEDNEDEIADNLQEVTGI